MSGRRALGVCVAFAVLTSCVGGRPTRLPSTVALPHRAAELANGMDVVVHEDPSSAVVSIALAVATGAGDDPEGREGLAHLVEHLAFQARRGGDVPMRLRLGRMGAVYNAWTSSEATVYFASAPKAALGKLCRAFADIARSPVDGLAPTALEVERGVVENERRVRAENGAPGAIMHRLRALVFGDSRLGTPIGGTPRSLSALTLRDVQKFAADRYAPQAMTLVLSGPVGGRLKVLEQFESIPKRRKAPAPPRALLGASAPDAIARVKASMSAPELWVGFPLPSGFGRERARMNVVAHMASGALASSAWERHQDVTSAYCYLDAESAASLLVCRATLSSVDDVEDVRESLLHVMRKGVAGRAGSQNYRYLYTRSLATTELLAHESLGGRTEELLLGMHFAKNPRFSLEQVGALEALESDELFEFYERSLDRQASRAVLALPDDGEAPPALASPPPDGDAASASAPDARTLLRGIAPELLQQATLANGLRVVAVQRPAAKFQTALIGFYDGSAREPAAVADATEWALRVYLLEPPRGVLENRRWERDSFLRVVRGPAGDPRILLKRLADGLSSFDFEWKSEFYLDFAEAQKAREKDVRVRTPRLFEQALLFGHPYGKPVFSADVDAVTLPQIHEYYDVTHRPDNALLVLVGPRSTGELLRAASAELGDWQLRRKREPSVKAREPLHAERRPGLRLMVGDRPTDSQVKLTAGCVLPRSTGESAAVEEVLRRALGARLEEELRQRTGATYGVNVDVERLRGGTTTVKVSTAVGNESIDASLALLYAWFVGSELALSPGDLAVARFGAVREHVLGGETSVALAERIFDHARRGLAPAELEAYPKRLTEVQGPAVAALLERCRATSLFAAVGDERKIRGAWPGGR